MKIVDVACPILQCRVDKPFVSARGWVYGTRASCVVEVSTDEGITGWGECYGPALAATVQFLAALPDQPPALRPMSPMLEFEQTPNPLRDHLAQEPIAQTKGIVKVPTGPGLGIEIDREVLKKYKVA